MYLSKLLFFLQITMLLMFATDSSIRSYCTKLNTEPVEWQRTGYKTTSDWLVLPEATQALFCI